MPLPIYMCVCLQKKNGQHHLLDTNKYRINCMLLLHLFDREQWITILYDTFVCTRACVKEGRKRKRESARSLLRLRFLRITWSERSNITHIKLVDKWDADSSCFFCIFLWLPLSERHTGFCLSLWPTWNKSFNALVWYCSQCSTIDARPSTSSSFSYFYFILLTK